MTLSKICFAYSIMCIMFTEYCIMTLDILSSAFKLQYFRLFSSNWSSLQRWVFVFSLIGITPLAERMPKFDLDICAGLIVAS